MQGLDAIHIKLEEHANLNQENQQLKLKDKYVSKDFEEIKRSKLMKMGDPSLKSLNLDKTSLTWTNLMLDLKPLVLSL